MKPIPSSILNVPFSFVRQPEPLAGEMRPHWRISVILVLLNVSRAKSSSIQKLHVLNWMIRNHQNRDMYVRYVKGELSRNDVIVRVDPGLNHAIDLARAEGLIAISSGKTVSMTGKGNQLLGEILRQDDVLAEEKAFALAIKQHITENNISEFLDWKGVL